MRLIIIGIMGSLTLTGCAGGASQYQLNSAMQKADKAAANCGTQAMPSETSLAWEKAARLDKEQCPSVPALPSQAIERQNCVAALIRKHVKPVSSKPGAVEKFLKQGDTLAKAYHDEDITRDDVNNRMAQAWQEYAANEVSYYQLAQCQNAALQQNVMPVYHNKAVLADFMAKRSEIAMKVDQGKLTRQQADLETQKAFAGFVGSEQNANAALQAQNAQAWREYAAGMRQASQQIMQAEQAQQQSGIKNTNCHVVTPSQMNCTSW